MTWGPHPPQVMEHNADASETDRHKRDGILVYTNSICRSWLNVFTCARAVGAIMCAVAPMIILMIWSHGMSSTQRCILSWGMASVAKYFSNSSAMVTNSARGNLLDRVYFKRVGVPPVQ